MKILHTADWHLGKRLNNYSRHEEQQIVLNEICEIANRENVDVVIIAGDLFDTFNPPNESTSLFYKTCKRLSNNGLRPIIAIAGNHDSPERIEAPNPLARECGIIFAGYPKSVIEPYELPNGFAVTCSTEGFIELQVLGYDYPLRILLAPYANEYRLAEYLGVENTDETLRQLLAEKWAHVFDSPLSLETIPLTPEGGTTTGSSLTLNEGISPLPPEGGNSLDSIPPLRVSELPDSVPPLGVRELSPPLTVSELPDSVPPLGVRGLGLSVNIAIAHLFVMVKGGEVPEEPEEERPINIGGASAIYTENFPKQLQYIALGHLHRQQEISKKPCPVIYSGSPLGYSFNEKNQDKYVMLIDAEPSQKVDYQRIKLETPKKLYQKTFDDMDTALAWFAEYPDALIQLTFISDKTLSPILTKQLNEAHPGIVPPINFHARNQDALKGKETTINPDTDDIRSLFVEYFKTKNKGQEPNEELIQLFNEIRAVGEREV